jgi:hypothetical protein
MKLTKIATALGVLMLSSGVAEAGSIMAFTDRGAFEAALGPTTTDTFGQAFALGISTGRLDANTSLTPAIGDPIRPGRVQQGVTFSTPTGSGLFFNLDLNSGFDGAFLDGGLRAMGQNPLTVRFAQPVLGFGFDTNQLMGTTFRVTIVFQSGDRFTRVSAIPASGPTVFFGFQSSATDIVAVQVLGRGGSFDFAVDNFSVARQAAVPEPSALGLIALALLALAGHRARS